MKKHFRFDCAEPQLAFIRAHEDKIVGQHIRRFYSSNPFGSILDAPLAFELDDYSIVISYYFYSSMDLYVVDSQELRSDLSLNFLYRDIPESCNLEDWIHEEEFPYIGQAISNIGVQRFSHAFEINASTGQMRPDGGDYFSVITAFLSSGQEFHVCALDVTADGYVQIW